MGKLLVSNTYILKANFKWLSYCDYNLENNLLDDWSTVLMPYVLYWKETKTLLWKGMIAKTLVTNRARHWPIRMVTGLLVTSTLLPIPDVSGKKSPGLKFIDLSLQKLGKRKTESISKQWESIVTLARIQIHALKWEMVIGSYSTDALNS